MRCAVSVFLFLFTVPSFSLQNTAKPSEVKPAQTLPTPEGEKAKTPLAPPAAAEKAADYSQQAFVVDKYLTTIRFQNDGTSEREQATRIRIQTQAGVQAF